jgi:hypothetical protein
MNKHQGQHEAIVIVCLASSTPDDLSRHAYFRYSKSGKNIAISRALAGALVLTNPKLLNLEEKPVERLRLVNTLACLNTDAGKWT